MPISRFGLYRASVRNNVDPLERGRLEVDVPNLFASPVWAEACVPSKQFCTPNIGDGVWLMFEAGVVDYPVWIGIHPGYPD
ncbi:phage baseplate assembly protein V [Dyella sp. 20L07]|uniref:phage baseplate assembly protein V n=1 Tax=Dyella sp. 20L07 TaxID=3384240 RepID=UPI003D2B1C69